MGRPLRKHPSSSSKKRMFLRKLNAGFSLLTTVLLLSHAIFNAAWMLSRGSFVKPAIPLPRLMFVVMMLHAILSIVLAILGHKGAEKRKCNGYANLNRLTYIQRVSGVSLILLTVLHILGTVGVLVPPRAVHAILPPLFFTVAMLHTAISGGKALITLGVGNAKVIHVADIALKVICGLTLIADVIGFYLYLV